MTAATDHLLAHRVAAAVVSEVTASALEVAAAVEEPADPGPVQEEDSVPAVAVDYCRRDSRDQDPENKPG